MYQHIYFHVALQSASTFKQLVKIIPDLYRWFKRANNREVIERHFIYHEVKIYISFGDDEDDPGYVYINYYSKIDDTLHSIDDNPAHIAIPVIGDLDGNLLSYDYFFNELLPKAVLDYKKVWYRYGRIHRDKNNPAIINRLPYKWYRYTHLYVKEWYKNGVKYYDENVTSLIDLKIIHPLIMIYITKKQNSLFIMVWVWYHQRRIYFPAKNTYGDSINPLSIFHSEN